MTGARFACLVLAFVQLCGCGSGQAVRKPDILLISIDTLRADHLSSYGYERATTPFVDSLAEQGVRFEKAYATAPWTSPSVLSMLTSTYQLRHGLGAYMSYRGRAKWEVIPDDLPNLAGSLRAFGYRTFGRTAALGLTPKRGFDRGFERYDAVGPVDAATYDEEFTPWIDELSNSEEPFFLWVHLFDPHGPYHAREKLTEFWDGPRYHQFDGVKFSVYETLAHDLDDAIFDYFRALYDSEIEYADAYLRELFDRLPRAREALVVFTADHGEEFLEHGETGHGHNLFDESLHIPLIVKFPDRRLAGEIVRAPASLVDVLPTILGAVGAPIPDGTSGIDLFGPNGPDVPSDRTVYAEFGSTQRAAIQSRWKLIQDDEGETQLFDHERDPGEQESLAAQDTDRVQSLEGLLREFVLENSVDVKPEQTDMSPEELELLKALGYTR